MELWDIYDKDRLLTGETMIRGERFRSGTYHLVVHVCIFNKKGEMLVQQRQPFKRGWSNLWDITVGGSAVSGETSQVAAEREVKEEIGYPLELGDMRPSLTINFETGFNDIYLIETDLEIDSLQLQYEEVQKVKWVTKNEILKMIDRKVFIPYHKSFINLLFDMRRYRGVHNKDHRR